MFRTEESVHEPSQVNSCHLRVPCQLSMLVRLAVDTAVFYIELIVEMEIVIPNQSMSSLES